MSPPTYEQEPQVSDYRRSVSQYDSSADGERELTLSTPTILGLFFALAIVCGCFFGLGYAMGHHTAPATPAVFNTATAFATGAAKPTAGSAVALDAPAVADSSMQPTPENSGPSAQAATVPLNASVAPAATLAASASASAAAVSGPAKPAIVGASPAPQSASAQPPGNFVVQVAAVSSQDVASILLSTLEKKGYAVAVHQEAQDKLLHVQIGPFADRKDAEAMRQRVLADGFNAIVK